MMKTVHFVLQGKGGVGKSFVSAMLAQYVKSKSDDVLCIDTDPVNATFSSYAAIGAQHLNILNADNNINARAFDTLMDMVLSHDGPVVIDNGASTFVPLSAYIKENAALEVLKDAGKEVVIHTVITGGPAFDTTLVGLKSILEHHDCKVVVWQNEFFGEVARDGKTFTESKLYQANKDRIAGVVTLARRGQDTYGRDIEEMCKAKLTFAEALASDKFGNMPKIRLKTVMRDVFDQLDPVLGA